MQVKILSVKPAQNSEGQVIPGKYRLGFDFVTPQGYALKLNIGQYTKTPPKVGAEVEILGKFKVVEKSYEGISYQELVPVI